MAGASVGGVVRLVRPGNVLLAAAGVVVGALAADVSAFASDVGRVVLAAVVGLLGTAGGNALNDLRDVELDRVAHPGRPLVRGEVGRRVAAYVVGASWLGAFLGAAFVSWPVLLVAAFDVLLLVAYELELKARGLVGNVVVALVAGSLFPLGGLAVGGPLVVPLVLGVLAALAHLGRELLKDAEDVGADRGTRRTFAVRRGARAATLLGGFLLVGAVVVSPVPHFLAGWGGVFLLALVPADALFLAAAFTGRSDVARARAWAKAAMVLALGAFVVGALL